MLNLLVLFSVSFRVLPCSRIFSGTYPPHRRIKVMDDLLRDIKFSLRSLLKDKGFTTTVILTLAVCIAANTATFAVVYSVLLKPLPVPDSNRILLMANQYPKAGLVHGADSGGGDHYDRLRDIHVFEEQAMFDESSRTMEINGVPERVHGMVATPSLFRLLRVS